MNSKDHPKNNEEAHVDAPPTDGKSNDKPKNPRQPRPKIKGKTNQEQKQHFYADPSDFEPDKYKPMFETSQVRRHDVNNLVVLDRAGIDEFAQRVCTAFRSILVFRRNGHRYHDQALMADVRGCANASLAIKLAYACSETNPGWTATGAKFYRKLKLKIPDVLYKFVDCIGECNHFGVMFKVAGLPLLAESFFIKAVHPPAQGQVAFNVDAEAIYVNLQTFNYVGSMREYDEATIDAWLQTDEPRVRVTVGQVQFEVQIPRNPSNWTHWKLMLHETYPQLNGQPAGNHLIPPNAERAIKSLAIYAGEGALTPAMQVQLNAFGYRFVDWNSSAMQGHWNNFANRYKATEEAYSGILKVSDAEKFRPVGETWPAFTTAEDNYFIGPVSMTAKQREFIVACGMRNAVYVAPDHVGITSSYAAGAAQQKMISVTFE